jgi:hypothetical protein
VYESVPETEKRLILTATTLYDYFLSNYYNRQADKLAQQGKLPEDGHSLVDDFAEYSKKLAMEMWEQGVTQICYRKKSTLFNKLEKDPWEIFFGNTDLEIVRAREGCPLKYSSDINTTGEGWISFLHNSFRDYLAVKETFEESLKQDLAAIKELLEISSLIDDISHLEVTDAPTSRRLIDDNPFFAKKSDKEKHSEEDLKGLHREFESLSLASGNNDDMPALIGSDDEVIGSDEDEDLKAAIAMSLGKN